MKAVHNFIIMSCLNVGFRVMLASYSKLLSIFPGIFSERKFLNWHYFFLKCLINISEQTPGSVAFPEVVFSIMSSISLIENLLSRFCISL